MSFLVDEFLGSCVYVDFFCCVFFWVVVDVCFGVLVGSLGICYCSFCFCCGFCVCFCYDVVGVGWFYVF